MKPNLKAWIKTVGALLLLDLTALAIWPGLADGYEDAISRAIPLIVIGLLLGGSFLTIVVMWFFAKKQKQ